MPMLRAKSVRVGLSLLLSFFIRPRPDRVAFVTRPNVPVGGNLRALLDELARQGGRDIGLFRDHPIPPATRAAMEAAGVRVFDRFGLDALAFILSSGTVVLSHSARDAFLARRRRGQRIVNVWHGVALKRIEALMREAEGPGRDRVRSFLIRRNSRLYDGMVASGPVDRLVVTAAFRVPFDSVHPIGLPRYDYLDPAQPLPPDLAAEDALAERLIAGRPLVLYAPTFRERHPSALTHLDPQAMAAIRAFCRERGIAFGIRTHPYEAEIQRRAGITDDHLVLDCGTHRFQEPNLLLRRASALVVDYSSIWVDVLLRDRALVAFTPDLDAYGALERGFIYDQERLFPGPTERTVRGMLGQLDRASAAGFVPLDPERHAFARALLMPADAGRFGIARACASLFFGEPAATARTVQFAGETPEGAAMVPLHGTER